MLVARVAPGGDRRRAQPDQRGRVRHGAYNRPAGRERFERRDLHAGRDREHERVAAQRRLRGREARRHVARFHRHDDHVGVGHRPRGARDDAHLRELALQLASSIGVDLGHRKAVGVPSRIEKATQQRGTHLPAADQPHTRHTQRVDRMPARTRARTSSARSAATHCFGRGRARGTFGVAPHFPERDGPSCTSGPLRSTVAPRLRALQDILSHFCVLSDLVQLRLRCAGRQCRSPPGTSARRARRAPR